MIISERIIINLNSDDVSQVNNSTITYLSDVMFNFRNIIEDNPNIVLLEGGIYNCSFPVSFYNINYTNNVLYFTINSVAGYSITIPVGNYNFITLASAMTSAFQNLGFNISLIINSVSGILTFTGTSGTILTSFNETYLTNKSTIWNILGFQSNVAASSVSNAITPPFPLNLLGIKKLKIFSNAFGITAFDSKGLGANTLLDCICVDEASYGLISYTNTQGSYSKLKRRNINQIDIQIKDENNNLINFNNASWSISLCLIVYRDYLDGSIQPTNTLETRLSKQIPHVIQPVSSSPTPEENINNLEKIGQIENKTIPTPLDENEEQLKILTQE